MTDKIPEALAVLDDMASTVQLVSAEHKAWHARIIASRSAFAELIKAAKTILDPHTPASVNMQYDNLRAALAAVENLK